MTNATHTAPDWANIATCARQRGDMAGGRLPVSPYATCEEIAAARLASRYRREYDTFIAMLARIARG